MKLPTDAIVHAPHRSHTLRKAVLLVLTAAFITIGAAAQAGSGNPELTQKLSSLKEAAAANKQRLQQYTWTETVQLTLKGDPKPVKTFQCEYGPDGRVQKIPIGETEQASSGRQGGKLRQRIIARKTEETKDYMQQVQGIIALYVPPDPQRMQRAFQSGNVSFDRGTGGDSVDLIFTNYAQPGDKMTVGFDTATKKLKAINVNTYLDEPKDVVTLAVQFDTLPDGTSYAQHTVLNATAKQLQVSTANSNYAKRVQ